MIFGFFRGLPYEEYCNEDIQKYKKFKNTISKEAVVKYLESLNYAATSLPSKDVISGNKIEAGVFHDRDFTFPYEFLHHYKKYDIGIPYEYEDYLKSLGVGDEI